VGLELHSIINAAHVDLEKQVLTGNGRGFYDSLTGKKQNSRERQYFKIT